VTMLIAQVLLAGMFAIAAMAKLADRGGVRRAVIAFGVPSAAAGLLGWALVGAELCTALLLLIAPAARVGGVAALVLLVAFSATVVLNLARGRRPHCHCFGRLSSGAQVEPRPHGPFRMRSTTSTGASRCAANAAGALATLHSLLACKTTSLKRAPLTRLPPSAQRLTQSHAHVVVRRVTQMKRDDRRP